MFLCLGFSVFIESFFPDIAKQNIRTVREPAILKQTFLVVFKKGGISEIDFSSKNLCVRRITGVHFKGEFMVRLSIILSAVHFCLAYGLRLGFRRTEEFNPDVATGLENFARKIEFFLTQPGRVICEHAGWADNSAGFWAMTILTSVLWGNLLALALKTGLKTVFR